MRDTGLLSPVWAGTEVEDLVGDEAWVQAMLDVEAALARAQARLGVIPPDVVALIERAVKSNGIDVVALARESRGSANPVVGLVRALTAAVDPRAAEYVHRGSTSQDILDSAAMLISGRVLDRVAADLASTADGLARLVAAHRETPMAGRTLTQHAVPITFGLKASGWLVLVLDALVRVRGLTLPAQIGGAAGTLAAYEEYAKLARGRADSHGIALVEAVAEELGLAVPDLPWHALRTPIAELGAVLSLVTGALGKFAVDVQGMARTEVGEVAEPGEESHGESSAMPQKRNPVLSTLIVAAARQVPAHALVLAQAMLGEDERSAGAWHSEWQPLRECLRLAGGAAHTAARLANGLVVFPERMRANLDLTGGTINAERVNVALAPVLGKAAAKKLLARISADPGDFAALLEVEGVPDVPVLLDPAGYLGAAAELADRALARYQAESGGSPAR